VKVIFFAQSRQIAGRDAYFLETREPSHNRSSGHDLSSYFPVWSSCGKGPGWPVVKTYLSGDERLEPDDEIAMIPPVSGAECRSPLN